MACRCQGMNATLWPDRQMWRNAMYKRRRSRYCNSARACKGSEKDCGISVRKIQGIPIYKGRPCAWLHHLLSSSPRSIMMAIPMMSVSRLQDPSSHGRAREISGTLSSSEDAPARVSIRCRKIARHPNPRKLLVPSTQGGRIICYVNKSDTQWHQFFFQTLFCLTFIWQSPCLNHQSFLLMQHLRFKELQEIENVIVMVITPQVQ